MSSILNQIEEMLERLGSIQTPEETAHRYELRRELLCSRYFNKSIEQQKWNRLMTFTVPLFAGGALVVVFTIASVTINESSQTESPIVSRSSQMITASTETFDSKIELINSDQFLSPVDEMVKFVPVHTASFEFAQ
ncbi:hypothetical protein HYV69_01320 [Candidatus Uhrbacteria bacterium]|nr:hypothetical protein [Candidatus Uhrbacteria bacterium]